MYRYSECGLRDVWLVNGYRREPTPYGEAVAVDDVAGLHQAIARRLVESKPKLSGAEFRFLRRELDLSQAKLARSFGLTDQTVAIWEKTGRVPAWADRFIRCLWREQTEGNAQISALIDRLDTLAQPAGGKQLFQETKRGWSAKAA